MHNRMAYARQQLEWVTTFLHLRSINTGEWQSQDISDKPMLATREILNESIHLLIPEKAEDLAALTRPNLPWAEDHFAERVSGEPLNPPPSEAYWPFAQQGNAAAKSVGVDKFSHTYPERFWPKWAEGGDISDMMTSPHRGIRFEYGDLQDVVNQLRRGPATRQAYLPVWFPEDTGAAHGERVPCTLGYHFLIRQDQMQITYYIRSCDYMRHFHDDVYMAGRLLQWMCEQLNETAHPGGTALSMKIVPGFLHMHIVSFHVFEGDEAALTLKKRELLDEINRGMMGAF